MKNQVVLWCTLSLIWAGCTDDAGLDSGGASGDCEARVLPGDYIVRSEQDADALEKEGGCAYSIAGNLEITRTQQAIFSGLNQLSAVGGDLRIYHNDDLKTFEGLVDLSMVGGNVQIYENEELSLLEGLNFLQTVRGNLSIFHNEKLTDIEGLFKVNRIGGDLHINNNNQLTNLDGLFGLVTVEGS